MLYKCKGVFDYQGSSDHYFWFSTFQSLKYVIIRQIVDCILAYEFKQNFAVFLTVKSYAWIIGRCSYKDVVTQ